MTRFLFLPRKRKHLGIAICSRACFNLLALLTIERRREEKRRKEKKDSERKRERERIGRRKKLQFDGVKLTVKLEDVKIGTPRLMSYGKTGTYDPLVLIRNASNRSSRQLVRPRTEITENTGLCLTTPLLALSTSAWNYPNPAPKLIRFRSAIAFFVLVNKNLIFTPDRSPPPQEERGRGFIQKYRPMTTNHL